MNYLKHPCAVTINKENIEIINMTWTAAKINNGNHWTKKKKKLTGIVLYKRKGFSSCLAIIKDLEVIVWVV